MTTPVNNVKTILDTITAIDGIDTAYLTDVKNYLVDQDQRLYKSLSDKFSGINDESKKNNINTILTEYIKYIVNYEKFENANQQDKINTLKAMTQSISTILDNMSALLQSGGSLQQVYNAQGLVTDLAATNDQISGTSNAPPAFSAGQTTESISFDMLSESMLNALTPKLSTAGGARYPSKKAPKKSKH